MRWCVIRHPDVADPGVVPEDSIEHYEARGWTRVSGWVENGQHLNAAAFPPREDPAPAAKSEPTPEPASGRKAPAKSSEESS